MTTEEKELLDDRRNPKWMNWLKINPEWSKYIFDLRLGFKRSCRWNIIFLQFWKPVQQNFWNGVFTINLYVTKFHLWRIPMLTPRVGVVIRFAHNYWFQAGIGFLFDRGDFAAKCIISSFDSQEQWNPGCNAQGWDEGAV